MSNSRRSHNPWDDPRRHGRQPTVPSSRHSGRSGRQQEPLSLSSLTNSMTAPSIEDETPGIAAAQPEDSSRDHHFGFRPRRLPSNGGSTDPLHQQAQDPFLPSYPALATYEALLPGTDTFPFIPLQVFGEDTGDVGTCLETSMLVESRSDYSPVLPATNDTETDQRLTNTGSNNDWKIISRIGEGFLERSPTYPDCFAGPPLSGFDELFPPSHRWASPYPRQLDNEDLRDPSASTSTERHSIDIDYGLGQSFVYDDESEWDYCDEHEWQQAKCRERCDSSHLATAE